MSDRQLVLAAALRVARGERLESLTAPTLTYSGYCGQFFRELVEGALGLPAGELPMALFANIVRRERGHKIRFAVDYLEAGRRLWLVRDGSPRPGDALFWEPGPGFPEQGHVAPYLGLVDGEESILENTGEQRGRRVSKDFRAIRVSPLSALRPPDAVVAVTTGALEGPARLEGWRLVNRTPTPPAVVPAVLSIDLETRTINYRTK